MKINYERLENMKYLYLVLYLITFSIGTFLNIYFKLGFGYLVGFITAALCCFFYTMYSFSD